MSNQEPDSLIFRIEKLELRQQVIAKYMAEMKRQLNSSSEQFNSQLQQLISLQDALNQLCQQFDERSALQAAPVEVVNESTEESSCEEEFDPILVNFDDRKTDQDVNDSYEDSQEPPIDTKEFLRRYNNKERDFTGINLNGANLSGVNLSYSNLNGANLNRVHLQSARLNGVNLQEADISEATLTNANLEGANLDSADIQQTRVY